MKASTDTASGPGRIRQLNRRAVLGHIRRFGPTSRSELIPALQLSPAGVSSVVNELIDDGLLQEAEPSSALGRLGRPVSLLQLSPNAAYTLGLVLRPGAGRVQVESAWSDYAGTVALAPELRFHDPAQIETVVQDLLGALRTLERLVPEPQRIAAVTVGIPGVVANDRVAMAPSMRSIEGGQLIAALRAAVSYPLYFQNDVNLAARSELHQQPRLRELAMAYLYIGAGVGAAAALRGQVWTGNGWAGEVGHLRISRGRGRRQSFEELLGTGGAIADALTDMGLARNGLDALAAAVDAGDRRAQRLVKRYGSHLCDLIQVLNAVLDLDEVIVDFPSEPLFAVLLPIVQELMQDSPLQVAISTPAMAHSASVCGAALYALKLALETVDQRAER